MAQHVHVPQRADRTESERRPGRHDPAPSRPVHSAPVPAESLWSPAPVRRFTDGADELGGSPVDPTVTDVLRRRGGSGTALPDTVAGPLGEHFGHDLSGVRVHADDEAGSLAQSLDSTAFTHGSDIYFAPGAYRPGTDEGDHLIAHELSHVVALHTGQDGGSGGPLQVGRADDPAEAAAEQSATAAVGALRRSTAAPAGPATDNAGTDRDGTVSGDPAEHGTLAADHPVRRSVSGPDAAPQTPVVRRFRGLKSLFGRGSKKGAPAQDTTQDTDQGTAPDPAQDSGVDQSGVEQSDTDQDQSDQDTGSDSSSDETDTDTDTETETDTDTDTGTEQDGTDEHLLIPPPGRPRRENTANQGSGTYTGKSTTRTEVEPVDGDGGGRVGDRTETTRTSIGGRWKNGETERNVFNGKSLVTTKTSHNHLMGYEAAIKTITEASDTQLLAAFQARARAGAFSEGSAETSYQRGEFSSGAKGSYRAQLGSDSGAQGHAKVDKTGLLPALEAAISGYTRHGIGGEAEGMLFARLWKLEFVATGKVSAFAGFEATAYGKAHANLKEGLGLEGGANFLLGGRASAEGTARLSLGPAELQVMGKIAGQAGVWGSATGKVAIGFDGVEIAGAAEVFAGVQASATGSATAKFRGKTIMSATGTVTVAAGIGAKASGKFAFKGGKLSINFGAKVVKGVGGGVEVGTEIDLIALSDAVGTLVWEQYANTTKTVTEDANLIPRDIIADEDERRRVTRQGYDAYIHDFRKYAAEKLSGSGSSGLNRNRVQKILDQRRGQLGSALTHVEIDNGIAEAAQEAFGPMLKSIVTRGGVIEEWVPHDDMDAPGGIKSIRVNEAHKVATANLRSALQTGATRLRSEGTKESGPTHQPDQAAIDKILAKHGPPLVRAHEEGQRLQAQLAAAEAERSGGIAPTKAQRAQSDQAANTAGQEAADAEMASLIEEVYDGILRHVVVRDGRTSSMMVDLAAIRRSDQAAEKMRTLAARMSALAELQVACGRYAAEHSKKKSKPIEKSAVEELIAKHAGSISQGDDSGVADAIIADMVVAGLGRTIKEFGYSKGVVDPFVPEDPAEVYAAIQADKAANKRMKLYQDAKDRFAAYAAEKTISGDHGVKYGRVEAIVKSVIDKVGPDFIGEADQELTAAAEDGLGPMVRQVYVAGGKLHMMAFPDDQARIKAQAEKERAERGRFLGDDEVNERRYTISRLVRGPLQNYGDRVLDSPRGVPQVADIEEIISDALGSRRDVLVKEDAQDYLAQLIMTSLNGAMTCGVNEQGKLVGARVSREALDAIRRARSRTAAIERAEAALVRPLRSYAARTAKGRPTMTGIEEAIAKVRGKLDGVPDGELDQLLARAVMQAFGPSRIKEVSFAGGKIDMLRLAR